MWTLPANLVQTEIDLLKIEAIRQCSAPVKEKKKQFIQHYEREHQNSSQSLGFAIEQTMYQNRYNPK